MRHTVKLKDVIIGHSELEEADETLGRAWGAFRPGFGYDLVQPIFRLFTEAVPMRGGEPRDSEKLARYHAARDKLGLSLVDGGGRVIATSVIHIADYSDDGEKMDIGLDVLINDAAYWSARDA